MTFEGGGAGRARGLLLDHRLDPLPRADDDAHPSRRRRHRGADKEQIAEVPFEPLTGLKAFVVANALSDLGAPSEIISPLVQHLPQAVGAVPRLRHDHARAQPDPHAPGRARPPDAGRLRLQVRLRPRRSALGAPGPAGPPVRRRLVRLRAGDQPAAHLPGPERRLRHQRERHDPRADLRRRRQLAGHRGARRRRDHLLGLRRQPALREDARGRAHLLQALAQADQRAVHHRRQVQQHRHLRRPSARWPTRCASTSASTGRRRSTWWSAAADRTWSRGMGALRDTVRRAGPALPHLRLRFGDERGGQLRPGGRPLDEGRRPRAGRPAARCAQGA